MATAQLQSVPPSTAGPTTASNTVPFGTTLVHTWYLTGRKLHALVRQPWVLAFSVVQPGQRQHQSRQLAAPPGLAQHQPRQQQGEEGLGLQHHRGEAGRHARSAVGMAVLPLDSPVEVELIAEVRD